MACDPNTLLASAACIENCTMEGQRSAIIVSLLAQIAGVPASTGADVNNLLANAKCIEDCLTLGQMQAVRVYLMCVIAGV